MPMSVFEKLSTKWTKPRVIRASSLRYNSEHRKSVSFYIYKDLKPGSSAGTISHSVLNDKM